MLNYTQALNEDKLYQDLQMRAINPIMKLIIRGKKREFISAVGKSLNMLLPTEANTSSQSEELTALWLSPDEWMIYSNKTMDENSNEYQIEKLLNKNISNLEVLDISDRNEVAKIFKKFLPEIVINLAAQAGVRNSIQEPQKYIDSNISGFLNILELSNNGKVARKTKIIGVTILTSLDKKALKEIGFDRDVKKLVLHQARLATKAKLDGIVCSAQEVKIVKKVFKKEIITPGIRFDSNVNDQKRVLTPKQAYKNGSDWLVIGRPITKGNIKKNIQRLISHLN